MKCILRSAAVAALVFGSMPAHAIDDIRENSSIGARTAAFAGARLKLELGRREPVTPSARLAFGMSNVRFGSSGISAHQLTVAPFEMGLSSRGTARFFFSGQPLSHVQKRLGVGPLAAGILAVGGLALGATAVAAATSKGSEKREVVCLGIGVCPTLPPKMGG